VNNQRTCLHQNCAPVCPHVVITPTIEQLNLLVQAVNDAYCGGDANINDEQRQDLLNLLSKGPYE
jgi:hypothetical protein